MTASQDAVIRAWAIEQGMDVQDRGRLPGGIREAWEQRHAAPPAGDDGGDDDAPFSDAGDPPGPLVDEQPPRPVAAANRASRWIADRRAGGAKGRSKRRRPGPRRPRVPVADLIADTWVFMAGLARPLPATSRLLRIQAPAAGLLLEDAVRDTVADRVLQPLARAGESGQLLFALLGPPALVTYMQLNPDAMPLAMPVLRSALLSMCKVMGPKMAEALKRETEFEQNFGTTVDDLVAFLFSGPVVHEDQTPQQAEDDGVTRLHTVIQGTVAS